MYKILSLNLMTDFRFTFSSLRNEHSNISRIAHPFGLARVYDYVFEGVLLEIYIKKVDFNLHPWKAVYISFNMGYLN